MPPDAVKKKAAFRELDRLSKMPVAAAEYTVSPPLIILRLISAWLVRLTWPNNGPTRSSNLKKKKRSRSSDRPTIQGLEKAE